MLPDRVKSIDGAGGIEPARIRGKQWRDCYLVQANKTDEQTTRHGGSEQLPQLPAKSGDLYTHGGQLEPANLPRCLGLEHEDDRSRYTAAPQKILQGFALQRKSLAH
jgi:hypothetical protein